MILTRLWRDVDGRPRAERANWLPVPQDCPGAVEIPAEVLAGSEQPEPTFSGWAIPAGVMAPAADPAAVAADPGALYELDLQPGAVLLTFEQYQAAVAAEEAATREAQAAVEAHLAAAVEARQTARRAAIEAFAAAAGIDPEVTENLIGAL
jgi:hypothetical protein